MMRSFRKPLTSAANYMHACAMRLRGKGPGYEDELAMIEDASRGVELRKGDVAKAIEQMRAAGVRITK